MKKILMILAFCLLFSFPCSAENQTESTEKLLGLLSPDATESLNEMFPDFSGSGAFFEESGPSVLNFFKKVISYFLKEVKSSAKIFVILIITAILSGLTETLTEGFSAEIKNACFFATFALAASALVNSYMLCSDIAVGVIGDISVFFKALIPVLCTYLAMGGNIGLAGTISPLMFLLLQILTGIINTVFLPLINSLCALSVMNTLTSYGPVTRLIAFLKSFIKWGLSLMLTVFLGILSVQGFLGGAGDSVAIKAAKFIVGGAVPIVGGMLSESVDMAVASAGFIKNSVGALGLAGIIAIAALPVLKMLAPALMLNLCGALSEPVSSKKTADAISDIAGLMMLNLVCVLCVFMFCIVAVIMLFKSGVMV